MRKTRLFLVLGVAAATFGIAGVVQASIPDSNGVIHGCYANKDGSVRVIDTGSGGVCDAKKETPLTWNQAGPTGATGPKGSTGPSGVSHAYHSYGGLFDVTDVGTSFIAVGQLTGLPAGTYVVWARGIIEDQPKDQEAECKLVAGGADIEETIVDTFATGSPRLPFSLTAPATLKTTGTIEVDCISNDSAGFADAFDVSTTAVAVDVLN
ncbi:MAG TPA: hypothetical protein VHS03_09610 [Gaiellaceae bacterium]|nr:hypothetical protein [Gaiellaceae bacterium]